MPMVAASAEPGYSMTSRSFAHPKSRNSVPIASVIVLMIAYPAIEMFHGRMETREHSAKAED